MFRPALYFGLIIFIAWVAELEFQRGRPEAFALAVAVIAAIVAYENERNER